MLWQTRIPGQLMKRQQPGNVHLQSVCEVQSWCSAQLKAGRQSRSRMRDTPRYRVKALNCSCPNAQHPPVACAAAEAVACAARLAVSCAFNEANLSPFFFFLRFSSAPAEERPALRFQLDAARIVQHTQQTYLLRERRHNRFCITTGAERDQQ